MQDLTQRNVVLFDFDGTLADTKRAIVETATEVLVGFGIPESDLGDVSRIIGPPFPEAFSEIYGLSPDDARTVTARYRSRYEGLGPTAWPLFEGIPELLACLRAAGKTVCVATSKRQHVLEQALLDDGVADAFDIAFGKPSDIPFTKADTIAAILELLHVGADSAVMVGDRFHDVNGAKSCGVPCIGVTYGGTGDYEELSGAGACVVVDTVAQLAEVLLGKGNEKTLVGVQRKRTYPPRDDRRDDRRHYHG